MENTNPITPEVNEFGLTFTEWNLEYRAVLVRIGGADLYYEGEAIAQWKEGLCPSESAIEIAWDVEACDRAREEY